jgi:hypothetical protein
LDWAVRVSDLDDMAARHGLCPVPRVAAAAWQSAAAQAWPGGGSRRRAHPAVLHRLADRNINNHIRQIEALLGHPIAITKAA